MSRQRPSNEQDALIECLREEARRTRPEFQAALHRRVWDAIGPARTTESPQPIPAQRIRPKRWAVSAVTAAAILLVAVVVHFISSKSPLRPTNELRPSGSGLVRLMDSPHLGAQHVDQLISEVSSPLPWASLRHDAELAWNAFSQDFPLAKTRNRQPPEDAPSM